MTDTSRLTPASSLTAVGAEAKPSSSPTPPPPRLANNTDTYALVDVQLELLLRYTLLDPLAEGGVSSRAAAALPVLDQAAALAVERRSRWPVVAVLLRAEAVHRARLLSAWTERIKR